MIFVPTLPQSGTWFVLELFKSCGFKVEFTGQILLKQKRIKDLENMVLSTHIFSFYYQGSPFKEALPSYGGNPVQDYIVRKYHMCLGAIEVLASLYKTVIPIRDPLACLLTREVRAPQLRHFYIVDGFIEVAKRFMDHPNVKFLPVDLYNSDNPTEGLIEDRQQVLADVLNHCDIRLDPNVIFKIAREWKRYNITPNNRFREPYENGDINKIKEMLGSKWAEVEHLKNHGGTILPLLSKLGYTKVKQLLW